MGLGMIAVWLPIVLLVVWLVQKDRSSHRLDQREATPLEELDHRYARGELDRETYFKMRQDLFRVR